MRSRPYQFSELRNLGLINEQIDWKQRFFVPTDEERGIEIISGLLNRYPLLIAEEASQDEATEPEPATEMRLVQTVDLDQWIVPVTEQSSDDGLTALCASSPDVPIEETAKSDFALTPPLAVLISGSQSVGEMSEMQLAFDF